MNIIGTAKSPLNV